MAEISSKEKELWIVIVARYEVEYHILVIYRKNRLKLKIMFQHAFYGPHFSLVLSYLYHVIFSLIFRNLSFDPALELDHVFFETIFIFLL